VSYPIWQAGTDPPARTVRHRTCGEPDCEVLAALEEDLTERGTDGPQQ
jgi:hypothetical protein